MQQNLKPSASKPQTPDTRVAIVVSRFNEAVTDGLLKGALAELAERGIATDGVRIIHAPGAFEIPLIAQKLAQSGQVDGVVCLGCVIKGDTAHFEYISGPTAQGLMTTSLATGVPLSFGILTTYTEEQSVVRSQDDGHNKGREAAAACVESVQCLAGI